MKKQGKQADSIGWSSGINAEGKPFVHVVWGGERSQFTPDEAREVALVILEVAEAAEMDAVVFAWLEAELPGVPIAERALIIGHLRDFRRVAKSRGEAERRGPVRFDPEVA